MARDWGAGSLSAAAKARRGSPLEVPSKRPMPQGDQSMPLSLVPRSGERAPTLHCDRPRICSGYRLPHGIGLLHWCAANRRPAFSVKTEGGLRYSAAPNVWVLWKKAREYKYGGPRCPLAKPTPQDGRGDGRRRAVRIPVDRADDLNARGKQGQTPRHRLDLRSRRQDGQ